MRFALAFLLFATPLAADNGPLFTIYEKYIAAIDDDDLDAAKSYLSAGKKKNVTTISEINVISPKENLRPHKEIIEGDDATLIVRAMVAESESTGRVQFVREKGQWKLLSEMWDIGGEPDDASPPIPQPKTDAQRAAIRKLRERGFPDPQPEFLVMSAVSGDLESVKLFLEAGYSIETKSQGSTAIVSAAMFGQPEVVLFLIKAGADVNSVDDVNTTALMRLSDKCEATEVVKALLDAGARTDIKSAGGTTAEELAGFSNCEKNQQAIRAASGEKKK